MEDDGLSYKVDKAVGAIRDVVIVQAGLDKDGGYFTEEFLKELVLAGNQEGQGVKCRFNHPEPGRSSLGAFLGRYKNFRLSGSGGSSKVLADLHLAAIAKKTQVEGQGISMWDYIMEMAENNPDVFGNSIMFKAKVEKVKKEIEGKETLVDQYRFESFIASDLVDSPAATEHLFKSYISLKGRARAAEGIGETETTKTTNMDILKKVREDLGVLKELTLSLGTGELIAVDTEGVQIKVGDGVKNEDGTPLPDGMYLLSDSRRIEVKEGKITQIIEAEPQPESTEKETQESGEELIALKRQMREVKDLLVVMSEKLIQMDQSHKTLAKNIRSVQSFQKPHREVFAGSSSLSAQGDLVRLKERIKQN